MATWETGSNSENNPEFTGPIDEEINLNQTPWYEDPSLFSNQLIKNVQFDENYNATELPLRTSRAWWNSNSFFGAVQANGIGHVRIEPAFSSWDLGPLNTDKWLIPQAILMASQNSIYATNARIDDLRGGVERMDVRVNTSLSSLASQISSLRTDATNGDNSIRSALATLRTDATNGDIDANKRIDSLDVKIVSTQKTLDEAKASVANAHSRISSVDTKLVSTQGIVTSIQDDLAKLRLDAGVTDAQIKDSVKDANTRIDSVDKKLVTTQGVVTGLTDGLAQLRLDATHTDGYLQSQIDELKTSGGFEWSDVGIIAAIIGIHDAWQSNDYYTSSLLEGDGAIVKLIKSQTKRIEEMLFSIVNAFRDDGIFWESWKTLLPELGAVITKCLDTSTPGTPLYAFRYSLTSGFMDLQEAVEYGFEKVRDNQIIMITNQDTILSVLEAIRDNTAIITQWLKQIYEKPGATFIQTPFDYERLQKMLDGLSFGEIVNEAGTNIWDFLTELIRSLETVLSTAIGEVSKSLGKIIDFLDSLLDKLIHLIVPESMDFMESKVDGLSNDFKMKFSFVFNWVDTFKGLLGNQSTFKDFKLNIGGMFNGEVNIPLSFLNQIAPLVRPLITGFVLLDFLIDMYKWFHTRGEVIE